MAGLPWIKVATDFAEHPKALALANRLGDARAPLHLPPAWGHFGRHYADGSMPDTDDAVRALERAALWAGAAGGLVAALVDVGLLERRRKRLVVHDWDEWQEGHTRKLERDRARMREKRAKVRAGASANTAEPRETSTGASRDGRTQEETERRGEETEKRGDGDPSRAPALQLKPSPAAPARQKREPTDPRFAPLRAAWERLFAAERGEPYRWQAKDSTAIRAVIAVPIADFEARALRGLRGQAFLRCSTVAQLVAKWNDLAGAPTGRPANGTQARAGAPLPAMEQSAFTGKSGGFGA